MGLLEGFAVAFQFQNLLLCFVGVLIGTLIGVLPGIGPAASIALLLPLSYTLPPLGAIIMLAGIYYGTAYGGSTTSILLNVPGEASSIVTTLDGYQMARRGEAGAALGIAAFGSFIAGTVSLVGLMLVAEPLAKIALGFGPPEYFSLMCVGLILAVHLTGASVLKNAMMALLGLCLSFIGVDAIGGLPRMNFGVEKFLDGVGIVPLVIGLVGVAEVLTNIEKMHGERIDVPALSTRLKDLLPGVEHWKRSAGSIARGSLIGFFLGIIPGGGTIIASFASYALERKLSRHPERFGHGAIEGVAAPESANNAAVSGALIPLLTLGIPTNVIIALLMSALMIHGIRPGPELITKHPEMFWGFVASMYVGNAFLLLLNLPLIGLWVQILRIPYRVLFPLILLFTAVGTYSINGSIFDVQVMLAFGVAGYVLKKLELETPPLIMAFVLGGMLEEALRQSLLLSRGNPAIFVSRPFSLAFLVLAAGMIVFSLLPLATSRSRTPAPPSAPP